MPERKLIATLRDMHQGGVQFIVVGGLAAVLQGAPVDIFDVDIVHFRDSANDARILPVLDALDAIFRMQPERRLRPNASHLASAGHLNLMTRYGPLDLLRTIGSNLAYEDLVPCSVELEVAEGLRIRVLEPGDPHRDKEELGGEKDRAVLPTVRRTLEEKRKRPVTSH